MEDRHFVKALVLFCLGVLVLGFLRFEQKQIKGSWSKSRDATSSTKVHRVPLTTLSPTHARKRTAPLSSPINDSQILIKGTPKPTVRRFNATKTSPLTKDKATLPQGKSAQPILPRNNTQVPKQSSLPLLQRLNASQVLEQLKKKPLQYEQIPDLFPKPSVDDHNMVAIYSRNAWLRLRKMLTTRALTMFVSGGSSMAGGGRVDQKNRCHYRFADSYRNVTVVDRAHGSRNSFHTMQLMHSYFPRHADILLWEFGINDVAYNVKNNYFDIANLEHRNQLILYLEQVARVAKQRQQDPPLVILLYLWTTPFNMSSGKINQHLFDSHQHLAENYDFVVGQVNAANYIQSWHWDEKDVKAIFLFDQHHPGTRGHWILSFLLNDFIMNEHRREKPKKANQTRPSFAWACGDRSREKRRVRDLILKRHPVASFTEERPKNDEWLPGMLNPIHFVNATVETRGKIDPLRRDRQNCLILPCCSISNISFDVSLHSPIQGIQFNPSPSYLGATVFFDRENVTNKMIHAHSWKCLLGINAGPVHFLADWIVMEREKVVNTISFCNHLRTCGTNVTGPLGIISMAVYGRK